MTRLVLASGSPVRARLLEAAGIQFEISPARVDEDAAKAALLEEGASARDIADALAQMKALRRSISDPDALVLGADQILEFQGECVSKSTTMAEAEILLRRLRGNEHKLVCATVLARGGEMLWRHLETATLRMRDFSDAFLRRYLDAEGKNILGSVGCYHFEGRGAQLFARIEGDYFSILGLPLIPVLGALRDFGVLEP
ncbi:MAG TPA: Maf family protein [Rhizomicrobium sp.]|jgi:septum formation protein